MIKIFVPLIMMIFIFGSVNAVLVGDANRPSQVLFQNVTNANITNTFINQTADLSNVVFWNLTNNGTIFPVNKVSWIDVGNGTLVLMSILNNGSYFNTDTFIGNYSDFLNIKNLTTNNTFMKFTDWNATNISYYLASNPSNYINWTTATNGTLFLTSQWNATNISYALNSNLVNGSYFNAPETDPKAYNGTLVSWLGLGNGTMALMSNLTNLVNWLNVGNNTLVLNSQLNNGTYIINSVLNNGSYFNVAVDTSRTTIIAGKSSSPSSGNEYYSPAGGDDQPSDTNEAQLMRIPFNGTLSNLSVIFDVEQSTTDTCVMYIRYNSTFGLSTGLTLLFANVSGSNNQTAVNKTASINVTQDSYIKMFLNQQNGTCVGTPSWSFVYKIT